MCGCPKNITLEKTEEKCILKYSNNSKEVTLNYVINQTERKLDFRVYEPVKKYLFELPKVISSTKGKTSIEDFKQRNIEEKVQRNYLFPLVLKIMNKTSDPEEQVKIAVSLVQNIPYEASKKKFKVFGINQEFNYSRYPYETLYENQGVCGEKSELLAFLLSEMGYSTAIFSYPEQDHEAVGVKCPKKYALEDTGYCFIETTRPAIISSSENVYTSDFFVENPRVINISSGKPLPNDLEEYEDAKEFDNIMKSINSKGKINTFQRNKLSKLVSKYSLKWVEEMIQ